MTQPIQMHRAARGNSRNYRWCTCGTPWINGRCGRAASPPPVQSAAPAARGRLAWGPFAVAITTTIIVDALLLWGTAALAGIGGLWAGIGVASAVTFLFVTSGVVALRRGTGENDH